MASLQFLEPGVRIEFQDVYTLVLAVLDHKTWTTVKSSCEALTTQVHSRMGCKARKLEIVFTCCAATETGHWQL